MLAFFVIALCGLIYPSAAYAYLDPGSGTMIFQVIVGAIAAGSAIAHHYWNRLNSLFRRSREPEQRKDP
jgi:hypothetical protein